MTILIDIVQRHLTDSPTGVDLNDAIWPELSAALETRVTATTAAHLIDIAQTLAGDGAAPPAAQKLVGVVGVLLDAVVAKVAQPAEDIDVLKRRSAQVVGADEGVRLPGQPPPAGALKMGPAAIAALRRGDTDT